MSKHLTATDRAMSFWQLNRLVEILLGVLLLLPLRLPQAEQLMRVSGLDNVQTVQAQAADRDAMACACLKTKKKGSN